MGLRQRLAEIRAAEARGAIGRRAARDAILPTLSIVGIAVAAVTCVFALSGFTDTARYARSMAVALLVMAPLVYGVGVVHLVGQALERAGYPVKPPEDEA
ncbi:hypothetical protein [Caulobacter segnis]